MRQKADNLKKRNEIHKEIYSKNAKSVQFFKQNYFLTCSWRCFLSNTLLEQVQFKFKKEKIIGL